MPYISDCPEWAILNTLKSVVRQQCLFFDPRRAEPSAPVRVEEELDISLRSFLLKVTDQETTEMSQADFHHCQTTLHRLCVELDMLVDPGLRRSSSPPGRGYAGLRSISGILTSSNTTYSLATGPGHTIFTLRDLKDVEAKEIISLITDTGKLVSGLLAAGERETGLERASLSEGGRKSKKKPWKDFKRRDRAKEVIGLLFADLRARCPDRVSHSVMLQIPGHYESEDTSTALSLMISSCPDTAQWVHVLSLSDRRTSMSVLQSLCRTFQETITIGKCLCLHVAEYMLHGEWCDLSIHSSANLDMGTQTETLAQLITGGVFKPASLTWTKHDGARLNGSLSVFTPMEKRKLALQLGYCVLDFFNTEVSAQHIYFVFSTDGSLRSEPPYLSFPCPSDTEGNPTNIQNTPILSFVELLLEIEIGEKRPPLSKLQPEGDTAAETWSELNSMTMRLEQRGHSSYTAAIRGCLEVHLEISKNTNSRDATKRYDANDGYHRKTLRKLRKIFYEKVIRKLEDGLEESTPQRHSKRTRSDWEAEYESFKITETEPGAPELTSSKRRLLALSGRTSLGGVAPGAISTPEGGLFDDTTPDKHPFEKCKYADSFIGDHRRMYEHLFDIRETDLQRMGRVKIAVLDTGCDINHPRILAKRNRIKGSRTWVSSRAETDITDTSGHGTHVTGLLLDMAPDSDIYIAQITEGKSVSHGVAAQAVLHAIREWKVDIITMSFGFKREQQGQPEGGLQTPEPSLTDAIIEAHSSRVLLFAAASNSGAYGLRPAFPARYTGVMCIYSGDGLGNSAATNPTSRENDYNFLTLGEAVESAWPVALDKFSATYKKRKSGTSFATPIAAGIAACLLLDARRLLSKEDARRLNESDKMKALLSHLSKVRNGYHVISVEEYFDEDIEGRKRRLQKCLDGTLL